MRLGRSLIAAILLSALVLTAGCGGAPDGGKKKTEKPTYRTYVAMGDSYTSGPAIAPAEHVPCGRSSRNYPHLVAARLGVKNLTDVSCAAASTWHLTNAQRTIRRTTEPPQLDAVTADTDLVTMGLGMNNRGASAFALRACVEKALRQLCAQFLSASSAEVREIAVGVANDVGQALDQIRAKAPAADIVLVGYPSLGDTPCALWPVRPWAAKRVDELFAEVDTELARVAQEHGARYVSVREAARDHGICSKVPWIAGITNVPGRGSRLHPLDTGQAAVARLVAKALS